jgi:hypothetical protein
MQNDHIRAHVTENEEGDAKAALWVKAKCELADIYVGGLSDPDPQIRQRDSALYQRHRDEAIASALAIKDEFYQGFAIHQAINLCRSAHDLDTARTLFKKVDDDFLREQILKDAPELVGEKKEHLTGLMELETPEELENWALEQFPRGETGGGQSQQILRSWFERLRKQVDPDTAQYGQLISEAVDVLRELQNAFSAGELKSDADRKRAVTHPLGLALRRGAARASKRLARGEPGEYGRSRICSR